MLDDSGHQGSETLKVNDSRMHFERERENRRFGSIMPQKLHDFFLVAIYIGGPSEQKHISNLPRRKPNLSFSGGEKHIFQFIARKKAHFSSLRLTNRDVIIFVRAIYWLSALKGYPCHWRSPLILKYFFLIFMKSFSCVPFVNLVTGKASRLIFHQLWKKKTLTTEQSAFSKRISELRHYQRLELACWKIYFKRVCSNQQENELKFEKEN